MHFHDTSTEVLTQAIVRYAVERIRLDPPPLDRSRPAAELQAMVGNMITEQGVGGLEAEAAMATAKGKGHSVSVQATTPSPSRTSATPAPCGRRRLRVYAPLATDSTPGMERGPAPGPGPGYI